MDLIETGDRACSSRGCERRLATPAPAEPGPSDAADARDRARGASRVILDPDDLVGSFERAATAVSAEVHRVAGNRGARRSRRRARRCATTVRSAVVSIEPEAAAGRPTSSRRSRSTVEPLSIEAAARADLGVTSATYGLATTGTVVQESAVAGGRTASLLASCASLRAAGGPARAVDARRCCARSAHPGGFRATSCSSRAEPFGRHRADHHARCPRPHRAAHRAARGRRADLSGSRLGSPGSTCGPGRNSRAQSSEQACWP